MLAPSRGLIARRDEPNGADAVAIKVTNDVDGLTKKPSLSQRCCRPVTVAGGEESKHLCVSPTQPEAVS